MRALRKLFSSSRQTRRDVPVPAETSAEVLALSSSSMSPGTSAAIARGTEHFKAGRLPETLAVIDDALAGAPDDPTLWFARGSTLFAWGRYLEALQGFRRAGDLGLAHSDLDMQLGWTCMRLGRPSDAEACFRKVVQAKPDSEDGWIALANALETRGALVPEAAEFTRILSRWPKNYDGLMLLAACRAHTGDQAGSTAEFRRAIELDPTRSRAWSNLGVALGWKAQYADGLDALRRAFDIDSANDSIDSLQNLATALREEGHCAAAMELLEHALEDKPDANALWLRSVFLLESGCLCEGWVQHEYRWMKEPLASVRWSLRRPIWDGQDLRGKTIMLHAEQGFGDAIQFIRYARFLKERGARVILDAFRNFADISNDFEDVDEVTQDGAMQHFDYHIPLLSLPRVLETRVESIPAHVPYVRVRPGHSERWAKTIGDGDKLKVGVVWAGNPSHVRDRMRSIPLARLAVLGHIEGIQFYSLQKGDAAVGQITSSGLDLIDLGSEFQNFCDTAAAISHLDLVISVDTSVAHLAGALGKPVWTLIAEPADWRWLMEGNHTPWYPNMRLFRQGERDRWDPVIDEVERALSNLAGEHRRKEPFAALAMESKGRLASNAAGASNTVEQVYATEKFCRVTETRHGIVQYSPRQTAIAESLRYYGEYRQAELALMERFIRPGAWLLEIGAGIGLNTLFMAGRAGPDGHVLAYEPDPYFHQIARQNLAANRIRNVTLLRRDIADPTAGGSPDTVAMDTVDGLRLPKLDWIRIDGAVNSVGLLQGAQETLWKLRPWLFVVARSDNEVEAWADGARDYGYQSRRLCTPLFNRQNYNQRSDDIFSGASALAVMLVPEEIEMDVDWGV